jgi:hypothetical protein
MYLFPIKRDTWLSSRNTNRYRITMCKISENYIHPIAFSKSVCSPSGCCGYRCMALARCCGTRWPVAGVGGVFLLSVADRIAQASVPVVAVCHWWLVQYRTSKFPTIFLKRQCRYCSKNFIMLHSNNVNVSNYQPLNVYKAPWHSTFFFHSIPSFIKIDIKCLRNFPTDFPLSRWIETCSDV